MDDDQLSAADLEAIRDAVEAVVRRDERRLAAVLADPAAAATFWMWADDYGFHGKLDLVMPPGPLTSWEIDAVRFDDGTGFAIDLPMWATFGRTDLTLQLRLERATPESSPRVVVEDMHVL